MAIFADVYTKIKPVPMSLFLDYLHKVDPSLKFDYRDVRYDEWTVKYRHITYHHFGFKHKKTGKQHGVTRRIDPNLGSVHEQFYFNGYENGLLLSRQGPMTDVNGWLFHKGRSVA